MAGEVTGSGASSAGAMGGVAAQNMQNSAAIAEDKKKMDEQEAMNSFVKNGGAMAKSAAQ
jgi:hypothetical protein